MATFYLLFISSLFLSACGPKSVPPQSLLDTAENHYQRGIALLEQEDLWGALREFERAGSLDSDFPGANTGNALVAMEQGDFWRARKEVEKAIHKDGNFIDAHIALGRIAAKEGEERGDPPSKWLPEAQRAYKKAMEKTPDNPAIYYYQGLAYLQALDFPRGREAFTRVMELNRGDWVAKAMEMVETIQIIERASPGSKVGQKIALVPQLTRAELAVLLIEELKLDELVDKRRLPRGETAFQSPQEHGDRPVSQAKDLSGSWAQPWVEEVLSLRVTGLELFPDETFQPNQPVTRANFALVNQGLLTLLSGDTSLATRYIGEESRFPDVRGDFFAYNAIALSTERGIMAAEKMSGHFRPHDPVSGAEALLIIRELQNAFRMEF